MEGDRYIITLGFVTGDPRNILLKQVARSPDAPPYEPLDQRIQKKLDLQMEQLGKALEKRLKTDDDPRIETTSRFHFGVLERLLRDSRAKACRLGQAGPGLMLGAWRPRRQASLGKRLLLSGGNINALIGPVAQEVTEILNPDLEDNCLFIGSLGSHEGGFPVTLGGGVPMLWWPLEERQMHDLLFGHTLVITLFNPAHLWAILRKRGFEIVPDGRSRVQKLSRKVGKRRLDVENVSYFEHLIPYALMDENAVAEMIDLWAEQAVVTAGDRPAKIGIRPRIMSAPGKPRKANAELQGRNRPVW